MELKEVLKQIDEVASKNLNLVVATKSFITTKAIPENVETPQLKKDMYGHCWWLFSKSVNGIAKDAWAEDITADNVAVGVGVGGVSLTKDEAIEKAQKGLDFILWNEAETKEIMSKLSEYVYLDVDDVKGHVLGAIYQIGEKTDSPNKDWNERVRQEKEKNEKEYREKKNRIFEETKKIYSNIELTGDFFVKYFDGEFVIYEDMRHIDNMKEYDKKREKEVKKENERQEKIKYAKEVLNGKQPCMIVNKQEYFIRNNVIELPENLFGSLIGKHGCRIEAYKKLNKRNIVIKKLPEIIIDTIWVFKAEEI